VFAWVFLCADDLASVQAECDALFARYDEEVRRYIESAHGAKTNEEARRVSRPDGRKYAARFMEIARDHPGTPLAADALTRAIVVDFCGPDWREAIRAIRSAHVESPRIGPALSAIAMDSRPPSVEPLLRSVLEENPAAEVRAEAALALSTHLRRLAVEAENLRRYPDRFERALGDYGREEAVRMRDRDTTALRRESERLLELVVEEYAEFPGPAAKASKELYGLRELTVGKPAPEIEGPDIEGNRMRLSDYRGKVVVLVWWATWCGPCMAMVPHERELARRMEGRPFVLLGVNGDEDMGRLRYQMERNGVTWRSWLDGGPDGAISRRWNIKHWPSVFVIDSKGVIRYSGGRDEVGLDDAVVRLLEEMGASEEGERRRADPLIQGESWPCVAP
jgi:thiol-disulfide isomerase/thioredoxin